MAVTAMRRISLAFLIILSALVFAAGYAHAQNERAREIERASETIADIRESLDDDRLENADEYETTLRELRDGSRRRLSALERELEAIRVQADLLGPAPGENDPPESDIIASERSSLESERARLNGERTRVLANIYETGELLTRLSGARLGTLYRSLLERGKSPLAPSVWGGALGSASEVASRIGQYFSKWGDEKRSGGDYNFSVIIIVGALVLSFLMFGPVNRWVMNTFAARIEKSKPTPSRRIIVAGMKMAARTVPGVIGGLIIIETLRAQGLLTAEGISAARAFWIGVLSILVVSGFTAGYFSPSSADWRIAPIDEKRARAASHLAIAVAIILSLKTLLSAIGVAANAETDLLRLIWASGAIVIAVLVFALCRSALWRVDGEATGGGWRLIRRFGRVLAILIIAAALVGYVRFADFVATRLCFVALFIGLAWILRAMLAETAWHMRRSLLPAEKAKDDGVSENFVFWSRLVINTLLAMALAPVFAILFGVPRDAVADIAGQALFGFNIGGVHIPSVAKLFAAAIVFVVIMAITRLVQSGLQKGPLAHSRADIGVQNSLTTLLGYAGLVIALFASISALGIDLGNLALIAGALSVGIGFGLQSIVNNFVSGLILLFERPIKVGDWIVTTSGEGTVKKISVRSTEVETFDRSSIIIPNSELISSTVTNWTHKNKIGRVIVPVGVTYDADPEQVRDILLECAKAHPLIVAYPEPYVTWMDFGQSSLDFEIRAYLNDISKGLSVRTELRFEIFKKLKEAGIEIPFPQRDVHIKSMPKEYDKLPDRRPDGDGEEGTDA
ncbi:mechanosensitive ion channel domain-containing protein [Hyphococcus formosus]|uniref:mechanosensitive ion channel family protein n=1 Tax=Hyphococcus formosus TaxID=3143534 RepID=UPI00398AE4A1